ncbi:hypothetical protein DDT56_10025 [Brenneria corticis]|uniref:Uncharacterized protein n=1 Tax=Brenneria corticis TaxID=2173106 RepID=A0A2U1U495_9GAMM|nr:hypothetical protein DDT56_10025 [Brenneria sp. CFCC 11842]
MAGEKLAADDTAVNMPGDDWQCGLVFSFIWGTLRDSDLFQPAMRASAVSPGSYSYSFISF